MNIKTLAFAFALLASGSTFAGTPIVGVARPAATDIVPGCNGGRGVQTLVMSCTPPTGRPGRAVSIFACPGPTFMGEFKAPGANDATVTVLRMPVRKVVPKNGSLPAYVGQKPRGRSFSLAMVNKQPHFGGYLHIFDYAMPGPDDRVQTNKFEVLCRMASQRGAK